jgi:hypothetical protein
MEVAFRGRTVADPAHRNSVVALDRRRHRPADRLRKLGGKVARNGEETVRLVRIHDRQLASLELVAFVRIDLAHHLRQRIAAGNEKSLLAIGWEVHVFPVERRCGSDRDRLFARALHVEAGLSLPLRPVHSIVEDANRDHVPEHFPKRVGVELRVPGADRLAVFVEDSNQCGRQRVRFARWNAGIRPWRFTRGGNPQR